ncbi:MAG: hypothetical protein Q9172_000256 [Xanthocarpia lactea]
MTSIVTSESGTLSVVLVSNDVGEGESIMKKAKADEKTCTSNTDSLQGMSDAGSSADDYLMASSEVFNPSINHSTVQQGIFASHESEGMHPPPYTMYTNPGTDGSFYARGPVAANREDTPDSSVVPTSPNTHSNVHDSDFEEDFEQTEEDIVYVPTPQMEAMIGDFSDEDSEYGDDESWF